MWEHLSKWGDGRPCRFRYVDRVPMVYDLIESRWTSSGNCTRKVINWKQFPSRRYWLCEKRTIFGAPCHPSPHVALGYSVILAFGWSSQHPWCYMPPHRTSSWLQIARAGEPIVGKLCIVGYCRSNWPKLLILNVCNRKYFQFAMLTMKCNFIFLRWC